MNKNDVYSPLINIVKSKLVKLIHAKNIRFVMGDIQKYLATYKIFQCNNFSNTSFQFGKSRFWKKTGGIK